RGAGLDANEARRQLLEERQHIAAFQLTADDHITIHVDAMNLKDRLCDIETDSRNRLHDLAPPNHRRSNSTRIHGTHVPVEEPSTASIPDHRTAQKFGGTFTYQHPAPCWLHAKPRREFAGHCAARMIR